MPGMLNGVPGFFAKIDVEVRMENIQKELEIIKNSILKEVPALFIYLFGSYAYGTPNKNSDIDIYAVVPDSIDKIIPKIGIINGSLRENNIYNVDLIMVNKHKFDAYKNESSFEETICTKGILFYEN